MPFAGVASGRVPLFRNKIIGAGTERKKLVLTVFTIECFITFDVSMI